MTLQHFDIDACLFIGAPSTPAIYPFPLTTFDALPSASPRALRQHREQEMAHLPNRDGRRCGHVEVALCLTGGDNNLVQHTYKLRREPHFDV